MVFELLSLPRMAGRVWAAVATAEEAQLSANDIGDRLEASAGAVSTATRYLLRQGALERIRVGGERRYYFRAKSGGFGALLGRRTAVISELKDLAARGMEEFTGRERVVEMLAEIRDFYGWLEQQMPVLIAEFEEQQRGRKEKSR